MRALLLAESILLLVVFVGMPLLSIFARSGLHGGAGAGLRAFNLPRGSIRAMLALASVGSYVVFLTFGAAAGLNDNVYQ